MGIIGNLSCAALILALPAVGQAQEKKIAKKDLPPAVLAAFQKAYPKATIKATAQELKDGRTCFEIESVEGKTQRDLQYLADGTLVEVEENLPVKELPEAVKSAVLAKYPKGKLAKAEKVTKGSEVTYDVEVKTGSGKASLDLDANGKILKQKPEAKK